MTLVFALSLSFSPPFEDEIHDHLKHKNVGTLAMVNKGPNTNGSQFYVTLRGDLDFLDGTIAMMVFFWYQK